MRITHAIFGVRVMHPMIREGDPYEKNLKGVCMDWRWLLLARYQGEPIIRAEVVCSDYFSPLTFKAWKEMVHDGTIQLPIMRMSPSKKAPLYVSINHLADFLYYREAAAEKEAESLRA